MAYLYLGDLHRLRAQRARSVADRDELGRKALAAYERCAALGPDITEVPRQLGLLYYQLRQLDRAHEAFTRYLTLSPNAPDAARVREYLKEGS
jgi:regulator of sirC expression with transglutaminase-like and TPR domain